MALNHAKSAPVLIFKGNKQIRINNESHKKGLPQC